MIQPILQDVRLRDYAARVSGSQVGHSSRTPKDVRLQPYAARVSGCQVIHGLPLSKIWDQMELARHTRASCSCIRSFIQTRTSHSCLADACTNPHPKAHLTISQNGLAAVFANTYPGADLEEHLSQPSGLCLHRNSVKCGTCAGCAC